MRDTYDFTTDELLKKHTQLWHEIVAVYPSNKLNELLNIERILTIREEQAEEV